MRSPLISAVVVTVHLTKNVESFGYAVQGLYDVPQELFDVDMSMGANFSQNAFEYFKSHVPNASAMELVQFGYS